MLDHNIMSIWTRVCSDQKRWQPATSSHHDRLVEGVSAVIAAAVSWLQTEDFYNFCDENGLLIWQDAMFGGSHYPRTAEWLDNYAKEIAQQVG